MTQQINIGIAEDHDLVRSGLVRMLSDYTGFKVIFEVSTGRDLLNTLRKSKPHVILLDIAMPVMGGIGALPIIRKRYPFMKVIVVSAYYEEISILEYVKLGANGFLPKNCKESDLVTAIYRVLENDYYFDEKITRMLQKNHIIPSLEKKRELTEREKEMLRYIYKLKGPEQVAQKSKIALGTVEWYKQQIMIKTKTENWEQLLEYAKNNKLI